MKYKCSCCGFYTFNERPDGSYDICPVCFDECIYLNYPYDIESLKQSYIERFDSDWIH